MIFYVTIANSLFLLRYALKGSSRLRVQLYPVFLALLFLFSAFRFEVGCDWTGYLHQFNIQGQAGLAGALAMQEPLWWSIIEGIIRLGLPYPWLNVASSAIFFLGIHVLARRQPDPLGFLVLLFPILIINMPMSAMRQGAAIGIMCIAFVAFMDKRLLWFLFWTVFASTLHNSAIIFLLLAPLVGGMYSRQRLALAALLAVPGALVLLGGEAAELATTRYIGTGVDAAGAAFRVALLLITGFAYFLLFRRQWLRTFPKDYSLVSVGALMMSLMMVLVPISTVIGDRLGYYLIPIQAMIFARIPYLPLHQFRALLSFAPYFALALVFLVWTALSWHFQQCYVPYQTWIFGFPTGKY